MSKYCNVTCFFFFLSRRIPVIKILCNPSAFTVCRAHGISPPCTYTYVVFIRSAQLTLIVLIYKFTSPRPLFYSRFIFKRTHRVVTRSKNKTKNLPPPKKRLSLKTLLTNNFGILWFNNYT